MLFRLMPMVERLCSMAEEAGCRMPRATQRDEGRVEGEHEAVVCVHALLQRVGDGLEGHQPPPDCRP